MQTEECLLVGNKIRKNHINYSNQKMKVKLAAQTFSKSVADALSYAKKEHKQFYGCEATIKFIETINDAFDILNSRNLTAYGFKKGLTTSNSAEIFAKMSKISDYISELRVNKDGTTKVVDTRFRTGFVGFLVAMQSYKGLFQEYVLKTARLNFLLAYKFSQDHLETLFSIIRSKNGYNDSPNTVQFQSTFKRLLVQHEIRGSINTNCKDWSDTVWLNMSIANLNATTKLSEPEEDLQEDEEEEDQPPEIPLSNMVCDVVIYMAGFVQRSILKKLKCQECIDALDSYDVMYGEIINIKNKGKQAVLRTTVLEYKCKSLNIIWL